MLSYKILNYHRKHTSTDHPQYIIMHVMHLSFRIIASFFLHQSLLSIREPNRGEHYNVFDNNYLRYVYLNHFFLTIRTKLLTLTILFRTDGQRIPHAVCSQLRGQVRIPIFWKQCVFKCTVLRSPILHNILICCKTIMFNIYI